jgi:putative transposase
MHCVWTLPIGDADFPKRWKALKAAFSKSLPSEGAPTAKQSHLGYRGIWQRGYWEHTIRDDRDYAAHLDYTHFNPVKHGYVKHSADWPYSSFHRCVRQGLYPADWSHNDVEPTETGERQ